jgi:hypothetical protein
VAEVLTQDKGRDAERRQRNAEVAAHPAEQIHPRRHPGELGAQRADVGNHQRRQHQPGSAAAIANECQQPLAGDDSEADTQLVNTISAAVERTRTQSSS